MNAKAFLSAVCAAVIAASACAHADIKWLNDSYDFGIMREEAGRQTGFARFVNLGPDSTYVDYVRPSCGCTDADFTKGIIAPGDTASVSFTYNPTGRPGMFEKTVKVYVGPQKERHVIKISGTVVGTPETLSTQFPVECGPIRLTERLIDLGDVRIGTGRHAFVTIVNQSADTVAPAIDAPQGLSVDITPKRIAPGQLATLGIYLNSGGAASSQPGERSFNIPLSTDSCATDIVIRANFTAKSEQLTANSKQLSPLNSHLSTLTSHL